MRLKIYPAAWTCILAASLVSAGSGVRAAEGKVKSSESITSTTSSSSDTTLGQVERADKIIGKKVMGSNQEKLGKLDDLIVDLESGRVLYGVVGSGGVLGAGEKKRAVAPGTFTETDDALTLNVDKQKFDSAPEFSRDINKPGEFGKADFVKNVYSYFGQNVWWEGNTPSAGASFHNVHKASELRGMKVENISNQSIGKIENLAIDLRAGRVVFAIFAPDRSLELGGDYFALPPNALTLSSDQKNLVSDLSKEKLAAAPHFSKDNWPNLSDPAWASQVYQYYGKQAYFEKGGPLRPTGTEKGRIYPEKK